jgi:hypothetical protein
MNPFDLKAALLEKHAQHPVINPHTHGVEHGTNGWLIPSCLTSRVLVGVASSPSLAADLLFF